MNITALMDEITAIRPIIRRLYAALISLSLSLLSHKDYTYNDKYMYISSNSDFTDV